MAENDTRYEVAAFLRLKGNFASQTARAGRGLPRLHSMVVNISRSAEMMGRNMSQSLRQITTIAKVAAGIGVGAGAAGLAGLFSGGFSFANEMENAKLNIATMFQLFGQVEGALGRSVSASETWAINQALAADSMERFRKLQRDTPAGAADLVRIYQSAASGLAQTGKSLEEQRQLITSMSLLGPALENDFGQIGRDTGRILEGGAGMDVRTWLLLRTNIMAAAKELKFVNKGLNDADKFTKAWNTELSSTQKFDALKKAISALGPEIKKTFGQSLGGLMTTTSSNFKMLQLALVTPLREGFRQFLSDANKESSSIFGKDAMDRWEGIMNHFGTVLAGAADNVFSAVKKSVDYLATNWAVLTEYIKDGFEAGIFIVKALLAKAIFNAVAGPLVTVAARLVQATSGISGGDRIGGIKNAISGFADRRRGLHTRMARGLLGGEGGGLGGMFGRGVQKIRGRGAGAGGFRGMESMLLKVGSLGGAAATAAAPMATLITSMGVVGIMAGSVGVIIAGMSAFLIENWDKVMGAIVANMDKIRPAIRAVVITGLRLWHGLVAIGKVFLGGSKSVSILITGLGFLKTALDIVGSVVVFFIETGATLRTVVGGLQAVFGALFGVLAEAVDLFPGLGRTAQGLRDMGMAFDESSRESADGAAALMEVAAQFNRVLAAGNAAITEDVIKGYVDAIEQSILQAASKGSRKSPTAGVHIENFNNNLDLRNQDPDRIVSAFIPHIERMTNRRIQASSMLPQGV